MLRKFVKTQNQSEGETSESTTSTDVLQNTHFSSQLTDNNNQTEVSDVQSSRTDNHRNLSNSANESDSDSSIEELSNENGCLIQDPLVRDTNIGCVVIQSSSNVHLGHKIVYNGPVTINQNPNPQNEQIDRESENRMAEILNQPGGCLDIFQRQQKMEKIPNPEKFNFDRLFQLFHPIPIGRYEWFPEMSGLLAIQNVNWIVWNCRRFE